jgi:small redox-active disulfide protein 2
MGIKIEVLGVDCGKCNTLFVRVNKVVSDYSIEAKMFKIEDLKQIATYSLTLLPALVINGKVVSKGTIPSEREILCFINDFLPEETKIQLPVENKSSKKLLIIGTLVVLVVVLLLVLKNNQINATASKTLDTASANAKPRTYKDWVNQLYNYSQQSTSYKITFLEFGSTNCRPCKEMEKVMQQVKENYKEKVNVVFYNVREKENKKMVDFFKIEIIPAQVLLDSNGVEYFRHVGYLDYDELIKKFR